MRSAARSNYFRNDLTDFIELTVVGGGPPCPAVGPGAFCFKYTNLPSARIEGYEFEGTYDAGTGSSAWPAATSAGAI